MKLSRRADYALRAVRNLSGLPKGKLNTIRGIAQEESIPREFLAKILKELTRAGILDAYEGSKGGYRLTRPARKISFLDVIEAVDGPFVISLCAEPKGCSCNENGTGNLHQFWVDQDRLIKSALRRRNFGKRG
jgi:Rrf2 family protein